MFRLDYSLHKILFYFLAFFLVVLQNKLTYAQCTGSETPTTNVTSNYNGDDVSCAGVCDGEITITMTGGSVYGYQIFHQNTAIVCLSGYWSLLSYTLPFQTKLGSKFYQSPVK